jgi:hypothetical protein
MEKLKEVGSFIPTLSTLITMLTYNIYRSQQFAKALAEEEEYGEEDRANSIKSRFFTSNDDANLKLDLLVENCPEIRGHLNERMKT